VKFVALAAAASLLLLSSSAQAGVCDTDLQQIDAALSSNPQIVVDLLAEAIAHRDQGAALCAAGNDQEAIEALAIAKFILGLYAQE
jgi:hypothetical protein